VAAANLLIGMVGIEFSDLQRFLIKWALGTTTVMVIAALVLGVISL
jgi:citrate-Mg2+:H+ or citrate-Ca2+:H+ symporter, CitMHS family